MFAKSSSRFHSSVSAISNIHVCFGEQQQHQYFTPLRSPPSTCPQSWIWFSPAQVRCLSSDGQWPEQPLLLLRSRLSQVVSRLSFTFLQTHQFPFSFLFSECLCSNVVNFEGFVRFRECIDVTTCNDNLRRFSIFGITVISLYWRLPSFCCG